MTGPSASVERLYPTHEHYFTASRVFGPLGDGAKEPVDFDDLSPAVRTAVRRIVTDPDEQMTGFDDPPGGLVETAERNLVRCQQWSCGSARGFLEHVDTDPTTPPLAVPGVGTVDGRAVRLTLTNAGDERLEARSPSPVPPFGVLRAVGTGDADHEFTLWSDSYDDRVEIRDGEVFPGGDGGSLMGVDARGSVVRTDELIGSRPR